MSTELLKEINFTDMIGDMNQFKHNMLTIDMKFLLFCENAHTKLDAFFLLYCGEKVLAMNAQEVSNKISLHCITIGLNGTHVAQRTTRTSIPI